MSAFAIIALFLIASFAFTAVIALALHNVSDRSGDEEASVEAISEEVPA